MGFQMGEDDRPFSERMWGLGRVGMSPTPGGRRGCMLLLAGGLLLLLLALLVIALT